MARMHSRKKGVAGSTKPSVKSSPSWLRYKEKEIEMIISKLAKEGKSTSEIGIILRDSYGIPDIKSILNKSMTDVLRDNKLEKEIPEDLLALIRKLVKILKHQEENKQDMTAKRGRQLTESKIRRLVNYYKKKSRLPLDWKYDIKSIKMYVE